MKIDIFMPNHSMGLIMDGHVFQKYFKLLNFDVRVFSIPFHYYHGEHIDIPMNFGGADIAIFIEKILPQRRMLEYPRRILSINPEWLTSEELKKIDVITEMWHKSQYSLDIVAPKFPELIHRLTGFTSPDTNIRAERFDRFICLSGKAFERRNTQATFNIWLKNPSWPAIKIQLYGNSLDFPGWIHFANNVTCYQGFMDRSGYLANASKSGCHLCLSETESFGHYINEARAMAAFTVILDAPPMNELINGDSGFLIPTTQFKPFNFGNKYAVSEENLGLAFEKLMFMNPQDRQELGNNARKRYETEAQMFKLKLEQVCLEP
ncbi:glycosyltransferase [Polynucleobacter paneuropaeus]|nr:glycosyltransferase [Polynucleobacter paneuropaeus]